MPVDAIVHLDSVHCITESDGSGHSEPYMWPVLLYSDDTTVADQTFVREVSPALEHHRAVINGGMKAGDIAPVPSGQQTLRVRFEDNTNPSLTLIVAMFEWDETPTDAARASYGRFASAVVEEVRAFVLENFRAPDANEPSEIDPIIEAVRVKVKSAGSAELSWWEKAQIGAGTLNLDDQIDVNVSSGLAPGPFTLHFENIKTLPAPFDVTLSNQYDVSGSFEFRTVQVDQCADEAERVQRAQSVLDGLQAMIAALQDELHGAGEPGGGSSSKPAIIAEIRRIRAEEIPPAVADLEAARAALNGCRLGTGGLPWHGPIPDVVFSSSVLTDAR